MAVEEVQSPAEQEAPSGRRSSRVNVAIPVTLVGKDAIGHPFKESTRTIVINKHGAKVSTFHDLALGAELRIENRSLGRSAKATVVWLGERRSPKHASEVGLQLLYAENIWGFEFPPADWQEGPPMGEGGQRIEQMPQPSPAPAEAAAAEAAAPAATSVFPSRVRFEEIVAAQLRVLEQRLTRVAAQISTQTQAALNEAAAGAQKSVSATVEQRLAEASDRLRESYGEIEVLLSKLRSAEERLKNEVENSLRESERLSAQTAESVLAVISEKASAAVERAGSEAGEAARTRGADAMEAVVAAQMKKVDANLATLAEDHRSKLAGEADAQQTAFERKIAQAATKLIADVKSQSQDWFDDLYLKTQRKLEQEAGRAVLAEAKENVREMARTAAKEFGDDLKAAQKAQAESAKKQLSVMVKATVDTLNKEAAAGLGEYRKELGKILKEQQSRTLADLEGQSQKAAATDLQKMLKEFKARGAGEIEALAADLQGQTKDSMGRALENALAAFETGMKERQDQAIAEAADLFRNSIAQMLLAPQQKKTEDAAASPRSGKKD